jgi:hypothetical protein
MAHFAEVNENNIVTRVIVVRNEDMLVNGIENEQAGKDYLASLGMDGNWIQTSYNNNFRGVCAGVGFTYDSVRDVFIEPEVTEPTE